MPLESVNDFVIRFANVNGSGSASANQLFAYAILCMGVPVAPRNIFPSNIQGLPTWYEVRVSAAGHLGARGGVDLMVAMNPQTWDKDVASIEPGGYLFYDSTRPVPKSRFRDDISVIGMPLTEICNRRYSDSRQRQLFKNIMYVGALTALLDMDVKAAEKLISEEFKGKDKLIAPNLEALQVGRDYAREHLACPIGLRIKRADAVGDRIYIEGNSAAALGAVYGGATVCAWYPITPSSSLAEAFTRHCARYRVDPKTGKHRYAVVQAEDELASLGIVVGAAWNGARAFTATSGPGISLMQEFLGLAYFAEVPAVIFDVQRGGPSTGMPTRTQQSDILLAAYASHGDTKHVLLFPEDPAEAFEFGAAAFDLADRLQTPILVMLDLDIGMNHRLCRPLAWDDARRFDRGKIMSAEDLEVGKDFGRYLDVDGDGIPYRTYPGTHPTRGSFFTRGSTRDRYARYTEEGGPYVDNMQRLLRKFETAKNIVPRPVRRDAAQPTRYGVVYYGSTSPAMDEAIELLGGDGHHLDMLRVRAFPFHNDVADFVVERERAHAQHVEVMAVAAEEFDRLVHRRAGRAVIDHAVAGRLCSVAAHRPRHDILRRLELAQQALHVVDVGAAFLGIAGVAVAGRAAGEERAARRMGARIGAIGNAVAIDVEISAEIIVDLYVLRAHDLAAVEAARIVPGERPAQAMVHADVEIEHDEDRRLQPVGEIERRGAELEGFGGILGKQQHVLRVSVRRIGGEQDVRLLGAGRHSGRGAAALHVEDDRGHLGEIRQPEKFLHQRDAGTGRGGERSRAVPGGTDHDAERGELVLGLHDGVTLLPGLRIDAIARAMTGEGFGERGGRRDRVPGAHGGSAVDRPERGGGIALDVDAVAHRVGALDSEPDRAGEVLARVIAPDLQGLEIGSDELVLALELLADQFLGCLYVHVEQCGERADVHDVLEELALPRIAVAAIADLGERHADDADVVTEPRFRHRAGRIVEQIAAGLDRGDVLVPGLRVHRHHQVGAAARAEVAGRRDANLVPGRQALNVGGKDVARRDRHAHAQDRMGEQLVGARGPRSVDVREANDEIVHALERHGSPASVISSKNFCMSQAPVGQRSAHSPQCRHTSSSFTITRPVLRSLAA